MDGNARPVEEMGIQSKWIMISVMVRETTIGSFTNKHIGNWDYRWEKHKQPLLCWPARLCVFEVPASRNPGNEEVGGCKYVLGVRICPVSTVSKWLTVSKWWTIQNFK